MWIVLKYIDILWWPKITKDDCQNLRKLHGFVSVKLLSSIVQSTTMSETINLVVWDHRFELSVLCEIVFFWLRQCILISWKKLLLCVAFASSPCYIVISTFLSVNILKLNTIVHWVLWHLSKSRDLWCGFV